MEHIIQSSVNGYALSYQGCAMNVEFQIVLHGTTIFTMPFKVEDERQLPDNPKKAVDAFREEHPDISLFGEDVIMQWRSIHSV